MLRELRIRNLAIIDDLSVGFERGLNVLTGETGAGKSIIVDALGLALGDRAQAEMIRAGAKEASVEAFFEVEDGEVLPDLGIDVSDGLVLRRVIPAGGKSRAYINENMVTLQSLAEVGRALVDVHSQHDHQSLLSVERQREILDAFGGLGDDAARVRALFEEQQAIRRELSLLAEKARDREQRIDFLRFQIQEIDAAALRSGEKAEIEEERNILSNTGRLKELAETAYGLLYAEETACTEKLSAALARLREIEAIDPGCGEIARLIESALPLVEDAAIALRGYRERYDFEPQRLDEVEERLDLIRRLEKKYGEGIEGILGHRERAGEELSSLESSVERLSGLEEALRQKEEELLSAAKVLSEKRMETAKRLEGLIVKTLKELAIPGGSFKVDLRKEMAEDGRHLVHSHGMDRIEFLFSANAGEPLRPLSKIISGGELSRVMLSVKSILAGADRVPVLIFDEVDAGIGGRTAEHVGEKLRKIAGKHQILCITHLPQIASRGDLHLKIEKTEREKRVQVLVRELSDVDRRDEIARMLSGTVTEISRRHARELLERAG